jgi:HD-like signal output (HDOD) protein/CheY-like chemotaxis protein
MMSSKDSLESTRNAATMKKNVLVVDDEPKVLQTLRHLLSSMGGDWQFEFVESGFQALQLMAVQPFHILISDFQMPGMNGEQLLTTVKQRHPHTARIIMCWNAERPTLLRLFGTAHEYLIKPCDPKVIQETLNRVFPRNHLLTSPSMARLASQWNRVPSLPALYIELARDIGSENPSLSRAGEIVSREPELSARILGLVNSPFFGLDRRMTSPAEAAIHVGVETIKSLVISLKVFSQFDAAQIHACQLEGLWSHSWVTAVLAKRICGREKADQRLVDHAFLSGLLHDAGKLVLATNLTRLYQDALSMAEARNIPLHEAEEAVFGASHAEAGGYLLSLWGLPDPVIEAVVYHHQPAQSLEPGFSPLAAVHVANELGQEKYGKPGLERASLVDLNYLASRNLMERYTLWQEMCWDAAKNPLELNAEPKHTGAH